MNQKRPRTYPVGVMAIVCLFLALSVVASREPAHPGSVVIGGSAGPLEAMTTSMPVQGAASSRHQTGGNNRHRQTRETLPLPKPPAGGNGEEYVGSSIDRATAERRRRMDPQSRLRNHLALGPLVFVPARGRRYGGTDKRQITIEQMLEKGDYFVPNRGKKASSSSGGAGDEAALKKTKFDVLLGTDEYFFPNRGKKEYVLRYASGRFRPLRRTASTENGATAMGGIGGTTIGSHPLESRLRRNLLENLVNEHKDTFFSSRGKRIPEAYGSGDHDALVKFEEQLAAMDDCETSDDCGMASELLEQSETNAEPDGLLVDDDILLPIL
ncbi:uncharacterized protein LOC118462578 [Anopheles albimanus]|uniref:Uncharacterized protein n=1 Tax=Anopheles albimanus TaxID=7167 RepID=A0A182FD13_ANOAL|nr:uncharacterized protein LOC118462578 [Anopheles albimanus]